MPKLRQYRTVKAQLESFKELGASADLQVQDWNHHFAPKISLFANNKLYRFSDPDWNIVSLQLAQLYGVIKNEKRMHV